MTDIQSIVIDNGSYTTRVGHAGNEHPELIFPTVVGYPKNIDSMIGTGIEYKDVYIGTDAYNKRGIRDIISLHYPIDYGCITNWNDIEQIWSYILHNNNQLQLNPKDCSILLSEAPLNLATNRSKTTQIMFETYEINSFYITPSTTLSLYSTGRTYGTVIDIGHTCTFITPTHETCTMPTTIIRLDIGGSKITSYLEQLLQQRGYIFQTLYERDLICDIKEKLAYIAKDYDDEIIQVETSNDNTTTIPQEYILPDGQIITIDKERFQCSEILFQPSLIGITEMNVHNAIFKSIQQWGSKEQIDLYNNIILCGGTSAINGLQNRLMSELTKLIPTTTSTTTNKLNIIKTPHNYYSSWVGGSILSSLSTFKPVLISKDEYDEHGSSIIHRKCF